MLVPERVVLALLMEAPNGEQLWFSARRSTLGFCWSKARRGELYYATEENEQKDELCLRVLSYRSLGLVTCGVYMNERIHKEGK